MVMEPDPDVDGVEVGDVLVIGEDKLEAPDDVVLVLPEMMVIERDDDELVRRVGDADRVELEVVLETDEDTLEVPDIVTLELPERVIIDSDEDELVRRVLDEDDVLTGGVRVLKLPVGLAIDDPIIVPLEKLVNVVVVDVVVV
jgi:hypothetical protein